MSEWGTTRAHFRLARTILAALGVMMAALLPASAQNVLRIFTGGQLRPDVMQSLAEKFSVQNPEIRIEVETGGSTIEQQQSWLNKALMARAPTLDLVLIDVLHPAQWVAAQWAEPLDGYLGPERDAILARVLPGLRGAGMVSGKLHALPYFADAQFLFYRKDLLDKYEFKPPQGWEDLRNVASRIIEGEKQANLRGFAIAGAPVESTVCTYMGPLWGAGGDIVKDGKPNLAGDEAGRPFQLFAELKAAKVTPPNLGEYATDRARHELQNGTLIFASGWGYAWSRFQNDAGSTVKGRIGIAAMPGFAANRATGCLGGWQVLVTSFSKNKAEAARFARFLASAEAGKVLALQAGFLPAITDLYQDREILDAQPWFAEAYPALLAARLRPVSPRYSEISEAIRINMSAFLAGTKTAEAAQAEMNARIGLIFK
jgi:multiple sugar transport system substrate-binding protein